MSEAKPQLGLSVVAPQARCLVDLILSFLPSKMGITIPPLTWLCAAVWLLAKAGAPFPWAKSSREFRHSLLGARDTKMKDRAAALKLEDKQARRTTQEDNHCHRGLGQSRGNGSRP